MDPRLAAMIDEGVQREESLLRRYFRIFETIGPHPPVGREALERACLSEGSRVFEPAEASGVRILVCDESSLMETGTYKDLDACLITASALEKDIDTVVLSSGGNLGRAVSRYASRVGLRVFLFFPKTTLQKFDRASFADGETKLICVDLPERSVKSLARSFAERYGLLHVPDMRLRLAASAARAIHLLEIAEAWGPIDCVAQTVCAAYGPLGIYSCFAALLRCGLIQRRSIPRFLGIQQSANAPISRAWISGQNRLLDPRDDGETVPGAFIEPGLYNTYPADTYANFFETMGRFGCEMMTVSEEDYANHSPRVTALLEDHEFCFARWRESQEIIEKAGLITGVGIAKAIDQGRLGRGETVVYLLTGGSRATASADSRAVEPDVVVDSAKSESAWVDFLGARFSMNGAVATGRSGIRESSDN